LAGTTLAAGSIIGGVYLLVAGYVLPGLVVAAWSVYLARGWWRALRRPAGGREVLRMDADGVTVHHGRGRGEPAAWSVAWPQVRAVTVREVGVPEQLQEHLGEVTKVVTVDVDDHRQVHGPADHRERLLAMALVTGTSTSRTRLQVFLGEAGPDAVRRLATWLAEHRPGVGLDFDVTGPRETARVRVASRVAVLAAGQELRMALAARLRARGLQPEMVDAEDPDALTARLRACTVLVAVDADAALVSAAAGQAGLDRVLLASTGGADTSALTSSDRAWTVLDLSPETAADPQRTRTLDSDTIAEAVLTLLAPRSSVRRAWRVGPDGEPVAVAERA